MRNIHQMQFAFECLKLASHGEPGSRTQNVVARAAAFYDFVVGAAQFAWQPIATAPRDGSEVLLATAKRVCIGRWYDRVETNLGKVEHQSSGWAHAYMAMPDAPLFWAPVPPAPKFEEDILRADCDAASVRPESL